MQHKCDLCGKNNATLIDKKIVNNGVVEYCFCEACYAKIRKTNRSSFEIMQEIEARKGLECAVCGTTAEDFKKSFLLGCPSCYLQMRGIVTEAVDDCQDAAEHVGKNPYTERL